MSIAVVRSVGRYGTTMTAICVCGAKIEQWVELGARVSAMPGPFPDDLECEKCGAMYNGSGQEIDNRATSFDPSYAGERWDEED